MAPSDSCELLSTRRHLLYLAIPVESNFVQKVSHMCTCSLDHDLRVSEECNRSPSLDFLERQRENTSSIYMYVYELLTQATNLLHD